MIRSYILKSESLDILYAKKNVISLTCKSAPDDVNMAHIEKPEWFTERIPPAIQAIWQGMTGAERALVYLCAIDSPSKGV